MLGPVDYIVVGFKGNNFDGSVLAELSKAVQDGIIRVIDIVFIVKDENGIVSVAEINDQDDALIAAAKAVGYKSDMPLLTEDDIQKFGDLIENGTSAGILIIEQLWALGLKKALLDKGAELLDEGRIHPENIATAIEDVENSKVAVY